MPVYLYIGSKMNDFEITLPEK
ncbi:hypothetical protein CCP4SC76_4350004 [Gammaproteobacteria bacterium]